MTNKIFYLSIFLLCFLSCKTDSQIESESLEKPKTDKIDNLANRYLELNRFSGTIIVVKNGTTIYNNNFGMADYENQIPFSNETTFKIGIISELITADIIKDLARNDTFKLSENISKYLPEITSNFTINDLLNHNSKLPTIQQIQEENPEINYSTIDFANLAIESLDRSDKSDLNYTILGLLIEKISQKSFQENLENYSNDLGLNNTYFKKADSNLAVGYLYHNYRGDGLELQKSPIFNADVTFSSNGLKSTANDLAKIINSNPTNKLEIDGYLENDGFSYSLFNNPKTKTAILVLSNRRHPVTQEISNSINAILQDKDYRLPLARKPFAIETRLLHDYEGEYAINKNVKFQVLHENDSLFVLLGPKKIPLIPQSENQFYMIDRDASMRFERDSTKRVNKIVLLNGFIDSEEHAIRTK